MRNRYVKLLGLTFKSLNWFEILLLLAILSLAVASFVIKANFSVNSFIAAIAAILGVFCVVLGAKGSMANWIFGIVEAFLHIYICFCTHIYGDFLQRLFYNLPMQFIGWKNWDKRKRHDNTGTIHTRYMTWAQRGYTVLAVVVGTWALGEFLIYLGPWMIEQITLLFNTLDWGEVGFKTLKTEYDSTMQLWLDSFTTVMSIITMYVSVKAFVEQWYMWLFINVAYIAMWLMSDSDFSFMTVAKYSVYLINSFYGIYMWNKLSKNNCQFAKCPMKKCLFIDRDGTLVVEPPITEQVDKFEQVEFLPRVIQNLSFIRHTLDFDFVVVSNQDGLGTKDYPMSRFKKINDLIFRVFRTEGVDFDEMYFDEHTPADNHPNRKPGTGMLTKFIEGNGTEYDLANSFVIGDRLSDIQLAHNLGCKGILLAQNGTVEECREWLMEATNRDGGCLTEDCALIAADWDAIAAFLFAGERRAEVTRTTKETDIHIAIDLDGTGRTQISTGLGFFDHMLEQIGKHSGMDLTIQVKGDLNVDEHHTIEDTGIALGECIAKALGNKRGIGRYGFCLPMDDCLCQVALDFGGRPWLVWDAEFHREKVGDMPTEMFLHFFKSFSDSARINLNIKAEGDNEHHKIEGIFKALARSLQMAIRRDIHHFQLPSSKGVL